MNEHILYNNVIANLTKQLQDEENKNKELEKENKELKDEIRKLKDSK